MDLLCSEKVGNVFTNSLFCRNCRNANCQPNNLQDKTAEYFSKENEVSGRKNFIQSFILVILYFSNWTLNFSILIALGLTCASIYIHPLANFFGMTSLKAIHWLLPVPFAILLIFCDESRRLYLRHSQIPGTFHQMLSF
jgi:hypothetical protein